MIIAIEGIDNVGKSTLVRGLSDRLDIVINREPSDTPLGKTIHNDLQLDETLDPKSLFLLFMADRVNNPFMENDKVQVYDRTILSGLTYAPKELSPRFLLTFIREMNITLPDFMILLYRDEDRLDEIEKLNPDILENVNNDVKMERQLRFEYFADLLKIPFVRVDSSKSIETVLDEATGIITTLIEKKKK